MSETSSRKPSSEKNTKLQERSVEILNLRINPKITEIIESFSLLGLCDITYVTNLCGVVTFEGEIEHE